MKKKFLLVIVCLWATTIGFAQTNNRQGGTNTAGSNIEVVSIPDQTFSGSAITPEPVIKYGTLTLKKDTDYTLSYTNNVNVGTATITITGKGNYRDTKTVNFNIVTKSFGGEKATSKSLDNGSASTRAK